MIGYMGRRLVFNRGLLVSCVCILFVRIAQTVSTIGKAGFPAKWDVVFVDFNNIYVGMFVVVPCLICAVHSIGSLISCEKAVIRFKDKDSCVLHCASLLIVAAAICSVWTSLATALFLMIACGGVAVASDALLLVVESGVLQAVFSVTCSCLFLMLVVLSGNSTVASIGVFLYASVDLIISGIPQVASWFPALSWAIVQITNPYDLTSLVARAVFPLLLFAFSCAVAILAYRKSQIMERAGAHHGL